MFFKKSQHEFESLLYTSGEFGNLHPHDCKFIHSREQDSPSLDPTLEETSQSLPINNPTSPLLPPNKLPPAVRINNPQFQTNLFWHTPPLPVIST